MRVKQSHIEEGEEKEKEEFEKREKEVSFRSRLTTANSMKTVPHHAKALSAR